VSEDFIVLTVVGNDTEAEIATASLRAAGIDAEYRQTNFAAGAMDGMRGGPQEILVRPADVERARELLGETG
jgi:Putative prokaryotic signal transducing protein